MNPITNTVMKNTFSKYEKMLKAFFITRQLRVQQLDGIGGDRVSLYDFVEVSFVSSWLCVNIVRFYGITKPIR